MARGARFWGHLFSLCYVLGLRTTSTTPSPTQSCIFAVAEGFLGGSRQWVGRLHEALRVVGLDGSRGERLGTRVQHGTERCTHGSASTSACMARARWSWHPASFWGEWRCQACDACTAPDCGWRDATTLMFLLGWCCEHSMRFAIGCAGHDRPMRDVRRCTRIAERDLDGTCRRTVASHLV